nr:uncharacterized protein LOC117277715 [Nicotiana tomentosiformis]
MNNTEQGKEDLNKGYAEYTRWLNMQDSMLKQKTKIQWLKDGDKNTKYFHSVLRSRRRRLHIQRIRNHRGRWVQGDDKVTKAAVKYYRKHFNLNLTEGNNNILECIPQIITAHDNTLLTKMPDEEEIKQVVFSMSKDSSPGPDRYNGMFFQTCWNIIKIDITDFVKEFFSSKSSTKFYTHTYLALIPKVDSPTSFADLRPISLSNYTNKIIFKILDDRLNPLLRGLISENQSGFVSGRSITDNVMLTQEIVHGISNLNNEGNVILKLDMAKAYDRNSDFTPFSMHRNGPQITQLAYADEIYHWTSWEKLYCPKNEAGIGIHGLNDISNTLTIKRWWHFRVSNSMWAEFLKAKYCSRVHPVSKKWCSGNSQAWKYLLWARDKCEKQITWKINDGKYSFWWDNRTELGLLAHICSSYMNTSNVKKKVNDFMTTNRWDAQKLYNTLPSQIALHIMSIELGQDNKNDYAIWNATEDGHFTNGSAWNMIREHREINVTINKIWHKSIPFKQSFMCWRIFFGRIPIRNSITRLDSEDTEVCRCCPTPARETLQHVFVEGRAAEYVWKVMGNPLGITYQHLPIRVLLNKWWNIKARNSVHNLVLQGCFFLRLTPMLLVGLKLTLMVVLSELAGKLGLGALLEITVEISSSHFRSLSKPIAAHKLKLQQ